MKANYQMPKKIDSMTAAAAISASATAAYVATRKKKKNEIIEKP